MRKYLNQMFSVNKLATSKPLPKEKEAPKEVKVAVKPVKFKNTNKELLES